MKLNKVYRRWIASVLAAMLVVLQLATAAYACAAPRAPAHEAVMAVMPDCEAMSAPDAEQPPLCKAHCERDRQSVNNVSPPDEVPAPVLDWLLTRVALWPQAKDAETLPAVFTAHTDPPLGAPPVYLAFLVLRT